MNQDVASHLGLCGLVPGRRATTWRERAPNIPGMSEIGTALRPVGFALLKKTIGGSESDLETPWRFALRGRRLSLPSIPRMSFDHALTDLTTLHASQERGSAS